jgi:type VI secretion system protein
VNNLSLYEILVGGFLKHNRDEDNIEAFDRMPGEEKLRTSIADNLKMILQTRSGSVVHLPDFGLPDILQIYYDENQSFERLKKIVRNTILKFEPRIGEVRVQQPNFDQKNMRITLKIIATIKEEKGGKKKEILFTEFSSTGLAEVAFERDRR